jgi:hypothetical protein
MLKLVLRLGVVIAALGLSSCERQAAPRAEPAPAAAQAGLDDQLYGAAKLPLNEFMAHVLEYNAMNVWKWQGFILNEKGKRTLEPKTPEEWEQAEGAALTLVELTEPLLHKPGPRDGKKWRERVLEFRAAATDAAKAAEAQNVGAFEAAGDRLNVACMECHYAFAPFLERPRLGPSPAP